MEEETKVKVKMRFKLAKYNGQYQEGMEPIEIIEWDEEIPYEQALKLMEKENGIS